MLSNELSASEAARQIAAGRLTSEDLVRACLDRLVERDRDIQAWVCTRAEAALAEARRKDKETNRGPLHVVPVGVKDVIETVDLPTEMNSPISPWTTRPKLSKASACAPVLVNRSPRQQSR